MKPIFEYDDYRSFLKDLYTERKAAKRYFSYRYIALRVGFKSAGYFTQVLKGQTNVSLEMAHHFSDFFGLVKKEAEYFEALVLFNQAQSHSEKKIYFEKMISFKESSAKILETDQYEYFSKWYYIAIREILNFHTFSGNFEELAKMVQPSITTEQAKDAVNVLEKLGLIAKNAEGVYFLTEKRVSSGFAKSPAAGNSVINSLRLAEKALDAIPKDQRELSSITLSASKQGYAKIIEELKACRQKIIELTASDRNPNRAYQFNFQVFPISKPLLKEE